MRWDTKLLPVSTHLGDPTPEVTWWQDQRLIDRHSEYNNQQDGVRNVLKLERMGRPDLHTSISCQAANTQLSLPLTKALTVEVNRKSILILSPTSKSTW